MCERHPTKVGCLLLCKEIEMEKTIYCPRCKRKVGTYDGRATTNKLCKCHFCNIGVTYDIDTLETRVRKLSERKSSSGITFGL